MNKIVLLILLGITLTACHKQEVEHETISSYLLAHYNFKQGSYWVYKDSLTGAEDSLYVANYYSHTQVVVDDYTEKRTVDDIEITLGHYNSSPKNIYDSLGWEYYLTEQFLGITLENNSYNFIPDSFKTGLIPSNSNTIETITNIYANYTINGNTFPHVFEIYDTVATWDASQKYTDWFYLSDSVGLVKIKMDHPHDTLYRVLELERYHIVK